MEERSQQRKAIMNAQGRDSSGYKDPSFDISDPKFSRTNIGFPSGYGDESQYHFWKNKAVGLDVLLLCSSDDLKHSVHGLPSSKILINLQIPPSSIPSSDPGVENSSFKKQPKLNSTLTVI